LQAYEKWFSNDDKLMDEADRELEALLLFADLPMNQKAGCHLMLAYAPGKAAL